MRQKGREGGKNGREAGRRVGKEEGSAGRRKEGREGGGKPGLGDAPDAHHVVRAGHTFNAVAVEVSVGLVSGKEDACPRGEDTVIE